MKIIYVAGPFTASTQWKIAENIRAAERVGFEVAKLGAMPLIPHMNTANFHGELTPEFWYDGTLALMLKCDAVMLVPGWVDSKGSVKEFETAQVHDIPVFMAGEYTQLKEWLASRRR